GSSFRPRRPRACRSSSGSFRLGKYHPKGDAPVDLSVLVGLLLDQGLRGAHAGPPQGHPGGRGAERRPGPPPPLARKRQVAAGRLPPRPAPGREPGPPAAEAAWPSSPISREACAIRSDSAAASSEEPRAKNTRRDSTALRSLSRPA